MNLTLFGKPVTKKNSQRIFKTKSGRPFVRPSAAFDAYQEEAGVFIPPAARKSFSGPVNVKCV